LDEIFVDGADLPVAERAVAVDRLCGSDAALRAQAESWLAYDTGTTGALGGVVGQAAASFAADQPAAVGSRFGPYHASRLLGTGGMGAVYLAARADDQFPTAFPSSSLKPGNVLITAMARPSCSISASPRS
jgi:serine/threonine-protein kinase